jgi:glycosyltransferase involved in cell wall biosynthesis
MAVLRSAVDGDGLPAITVIIPTHNRAALLPRALNSVLAQDFASFEVIVVDDGSTDDTAAVLSRRADDRLHVLRHAQALGAAGARNSALALARAPIVAFLDDDDEMLPGFLAATAGAHAQLPTVDLCWTGVIFQHKDGSRKIQDWSRWAGSRRFVNRLAGCCGISLRTERLRAMGGFDRSFRIAEDTDLFMRLVESGGTWRCIAQPLMKVDVHPGASLSRSGNSELHIEHIRRLLERHGALIEADPAIWRQYHGSLTNHLYRAGHLREARRELLRMLGRRGSFTLALESILRFELRGRRLWQRAR